MIFSLLDLPARKSGTNTHSQESSPAMLLVPNPCAFDDASTKQFSGACAHLRFDERIRTARTPLARR